jgi:hypothetical protein
MSKLFEKLLLKRLKPIIEEKNLIPYHQFGFRPQNSMIDQVHRITNITEQSLEEKKACSPIFWTLLRLSIVWNEGLNQKLKLLLTVQYSRILESYLSERHFRIKQEDAYLHLRKIQAGVLQESVPGPDYISYTLVTYQRLNKMLLQHLQMIL